jgi:membrane protease subunit (stomatin/prohibitin family)
MSLDKGAVLEAIAGCMALMQNLQRLMEAEPDRRQAEIGGTEQQAQRASYVTVAHAAQLTGLSEKAIRRKIEEDKWLNGQEYRRSPDGRIFVSLDGFRRWVEKGR